MIRRKVDQSLETARCNPFVEALLRILIKEVKDLESRRCPADLGDGSACLDLFSLSLAQVG